MEGTFRFPASEMSTRIDLALCLSTRDRAEDARKLLMSGGFDQAPVLDQGRLVGWVRLTDLGGRGLVASSLRPLDRTVVLASSASVGDALDQLARGQLIFLAGSSGITEFTVPSDLDRHVVRSYLYVLLSAVEFRLAEIVKRHLTDDEIIGKFRRESRSRFEAARVKGQETRAVEYLYLLDYAPLLKLIPELATSPWSARDQAKDLQRLNALRNCVAHPSRSLTGEFGPEDVAHLARRASEVLAYLGQ